MGGMPQGEGQMEGIASLGLLPVPGMDQMMGGAPMDSFSIQVPDQPMPDASMGAQMPPMGPQMYGAGMPQASPQMAPPEIPQMSKNAMDSVKVGVVPQGYEGYNEMFTNPGMVGAGKQLAYQQNNANLAKQRMFRDNFMNDARRA